MLVGYVCWPSRAKDHGSWSSQQQDRHSHPSNGVMGGLRFGFPENEMGDWGGNGRKEVKAERGEGERGAGENEQRKDEGQLRLATAVTRPDGYTTLAQLSSAHLSSSQLGSRVQGNQPGQGASSNRL